MAAAEPRDFLSQYPGWREGIRPKAFTTNNSEMNWEEIFKLISPHLYRGCQVWFPVNLKCPRYVFELEGN